MDPYEPRVEETFDIVICDKATQWVELSVFDYDMATMDKLLGKANLEVWKLSNHAQETRMLRLLGGGKGELEVSCQYTPTGTSKTKQQQGGADRSRTDSANILCSICASPS